MTVSDQIIQVLDALCDKFGLAIDWTSENVIPYLTTLATKLVSFEIWTSVAWIVFTLLGCLVAIVIYRKNRESLCDFIRYEDLAIVPILLFIFLGLSGVACIIEQTLDIIKCLTFPEMFIFEYIQNVINTAH